MNFLYMYVIYENKTIDFYNCLNIEKFSLILDSHFSYIFFSPPVPNLICLTAWIRVIIGFPISEKLEGDLFFWKVMGNRGINSKYLLRIKVRNWREFDENM